MAANTLGRNIEFPIFNSDGTRFNNLVMHKATYDSVVMSLGDKITGDVYYRDNTLAVTMQEYIEYDGLKFILVDPPTVVREGMVSDNDQLKGMTKYSFTFYHPMCRLSNFPFTDIAVTQAQSKYLSQNKTFSWVGNLFDFINKINANIESTEWIVGANIEQYEQDGQTETAQWQKASKISDVLPFDEQYISDALKTAYDEWEIPFTITSINENGKKFLVEFGLPTNEIYQLDEHGQQTQTPFVFQFGKGVGLKNNSRTPKNNKIVTRLAGYGSENNIPYGYPQIIWTGDQSWEYTINNSSSANNSYPIYDGIANGQLVRLIKHPFTRTHLMPSIYSETVNKKVNPLAVGYSPDTVIIDYYDATVAGGFPNPIVLNSPSYEIHGFDDIKPELGNESIVSAVPYDEDERPVSYVFNTVISFLFVLSSSIATSKSENEKAAIQRLYDAIDGGARTYSDGNNGGAYTFSCVVTNNGSVMYVKYTSDSFNIDTAVLYGSSQPQWIDDIDENGNYLQSYFKMTLPQLSFDLYASAAITQSMSINMRSGNCIGCTFTVMVDWEDYKLNFYDNNGDFDPTIGEGHPRDGEKYPDSSRGQITLILQKDNETFGKIMPNIYQQPHAGDKFVILGISLPLSYIANAESRLDSAMNEYMLENNVYYYDYPLKFDEYFLATNTGILSQIKNNSVVRFKYVQDITIALYIKQISIKYGESTLPQYDITITDDVEIVLNKIGQVTDDVSRVRVQLSELQKYYSQNQSDIINQKLSRIEDDICQGRITFQQGLDAIGSVIFHDELKSPQFETGLYSGKGWRIDQLGNAEMESLKVRSYLEIVELLVNRMQAQEGDTLFTDNDQIDKVDKITSPVDGSVTYVLSLKEKYDGYVTAQMNGNIVKGIVNTLAAKDAGVSDETLNNVDKQGVDDGGNHYYTSWMRVIDTHSTDNTLGVNQIRVVLYGDNDVPAQKNFEPCQLMNIARWGCSLNPDEQGITDAEKQSRIRRQRMFQISVSEGRVTKYENVNTPILRNDNYGVTIGELPEFVKNYSEVRSVLNVVGEHTDWIYAQGIVVANFIKVDRQGHPIINYVDCGAWVDGSQTTPSVGHGIYLVNEYNEQTQQYETHDVWHDGCKYRCLQHQPVTVSGVTTYYEPRWNSAYWELIEGNTNLSLEFVSSSGYSFRRGFVDTVITPYIYYGSVDITTDVLDDPSVQQTLGDVITWTRTSEHPTPESEARDATWNGQHTGLKTLHLTNVDMDITWSSSNKQIFICTIVVNDGKQTVIVQNQVIA